MHLCVLKMGYEVGSYMWRGRNMLILHVNWLKRGGLSLNSCLKFDTLEMLEGLCRLGMKKIKGKHLDFCQIAHAVVEAATDESEQVEQPDTRNPHAVALGGLGGQKGGKARAEKLSPEQRQGIAKKAAEKRWSKSRKDEL
jgi:hypothetical protein